MNLSRHERHEDAFPAYEKLIGPYAEEVQKLPTGSRGLVYPKTKFGGSILKTMAGIAAGKAVQKVVGLFSSHDAGEEKEGCDLPGY